jgi:hypothetical protein
MQKSALGAQGSLDAGAAPRRGRRSCGAGLAKWDRLSLLGAEQSRTLALGESGASSVKGGSEQRTALLGCP